MKFSGKVDNGPLNKRLNFGGDSDPYRDTGKTCFGGGMHCHSASSLYLKFQDCSIAWSNFHAVILIDATAYIFIACFIAYACLHHVIS